MTYRCTSCDVNWWPYMTDGGACVLCGGGTFRSGGAPTPGCGELHRAAIAAQNAREAHQKAHEDFERYYADREAERLRNALERGIAA